MMNKTNAFTTRNSNKERIAKLREQLDLLWEDNRNSYTDYVATLKNFLAAHPNMTATQIARTLGETEDEARSIRMSVQGLSLGAEQLRYHKEDMENWNELPESEKEKIRKMGYWCNGKHYHFIPDEHDCYATIPNLCRKKMIKTRHFIEVDSEGNEISRFDTTAEAKVYYLDKDA